ncbi:hypothetical protein V493_04523 [Pseudogymnoascus sp. VKM F-4281 (FW-2241)]|nr:hypothetical protein V493_04523 [Pseudogymnoascus sp. VKM F-4281 (FW-2241)]
MGLDFDDIVPDVAKPNVLNPESRLRFHPHFVLRAQLCDAVVVPSTESLHCGDSGHPSDRRMLCRPSNIRTETGSHCFRLGRLPGRSCSDVIIWHVGIHIWDVDQYNLEPSYTEYHKILIAYNLLYTPILPLVKASIIFLLLRAGWVVTPIRKTLYGILAFVIGACLGPWLALIFLCPPLTGETSKPTVYGGLSCLTPKQGGIIYVFLVTANMFTDLLILPIPSLLVYRIRNASLQSRLTVIFSFALSLGVTAMGAVRLKLNYQSILYKHHDSDWTYTIVYCLSHAENNVAIIIACMPPLRSLILRWTSNKDEEALVRDQSDTINRRIYGESFTLRPMSATEDAKDQFVGTSKHNEGF